MYAGCPTLLQVNRRQRHLQRRPNLGFMSLISYLAEDNETIAKNLIETLREICEVKVVAVGATQNEASHWLADHDTEWDLAIVACF